MHTNVADFVALDAVAVRASAELVACARPRHGTANALCGLDAARANLSHGRSALRIRRRRGRRRRCGAVASPPPGQRSRRGLPCVSGDRAGRVLRGRGTGPPVSAARVRRRGGLPARQAVSFHFVDYVVHSWDVARALGLEVHFTQELLDAALPVAQAVPNGEARLAPGAAFSPAVAWQDGSPLDRIVTILGRSPDWKSPDCPALRDVQAEDGEQGHAGNGSR